MGLISAIEIASFSLLFGSPNGTTGRLSARLPIRQRALKPSAPTCRSAGRKLPTNDWPSNSTAPTKSYPA